MFEFRLTPNFTDNDFSEILKFKHVCLQIAEFLNMFSANLQQNITLSSEYSTNFPPSSLHSFRRILKNDTESGNLPEVLLTDFKATFSNMFYNSALDDYDNIDFTYRNITVDNNGTCEYNNINYLNTRHAS